MQAACLKSNNILLNFTMLFSIGLCLQETVVMCKARVFFMRNQLLENFEKLRFSCHSEQRREYGGEKLQHMIN